MTVETLAKRLAAAAILGGFGMLAAAVICWATAGDGDEVVRSIHAVGGSILGVLAAVAIATGLVIIDAFTSGATDEPSAGSES